MADIRLHNKQNTVTNVPNIFIDEYMANANGEFVKIYLYLLRCMNTPDCDFSISMIADRMDYTERDVTRALTYWEKMNLLHLEYDPADGSLSGIYLVDSQSFTMGQPPVSASFAPQQMQTPQITAPAMTQSQHMAAPAMTQSQQMTPQTMAQPQQVSAPQMNHIPEKRSFTREELLAFQEKESVQELAFISEQYLGRPLTPKEFDSFLYWNECLEFPFELIEYLIEYCVSKNHTSIHYMDKVALAWAESGIRTVEQAKQQTNTRSQNTFTVMKAFGITGRNLVEFETDYIKKWTSEYGFTLDIISEACTRTIQAIQKPSFEYADTILSSWNRSNVHHMEDIVKLDSAFQKSKTSAAVTAKQTGPANNKFNNFPQRSYNYDQLEQQLLDSSLQ